LRHISLAIYDDPPSEQFVPALAGFAETLPPFEVALARIGLFADATNAGSLGVVFLGVAFLGVVFLGGVATEAPLALHRRAHAL